MNYSGFLKQLIAAIAIGKLSCNLTGIFSEVMCIQIFLKNEGKKRY